EPAFVVSDLEIRRPGPSYMADTVDALGMAPAELFVLIGSETFLDLLAWHDPRRLAARCRLVVIPRAGSAFDPEGAAALKVLHEIGADGISVVEEGHTVPSRGVIVVHATSLPISAS